MQLSRQKSVSRHAYCAAVVVSGLYVIGGAIAPSSHYRDSYPEVGKDAARSIRERTSNQQYKRLIINPDMDSLAGVAIRAGPRVI